MNGTVLIVDDEIDIRETLQEVLEEEGYDVITAESVEKALDIPLTSIDIALVDIRIGTGDGIALLKSFQQNRPLLPVVMITGHASVALASEAFRCGAYEFLEKPLRLLQVRTVVRNAVESIRLKEEVQSGERVKPIYRSALMKQLFAQAARLASVNASVVITGESGAGKELVAESLHYEGSRRNAPFIAVNAASLPANLAEDELFGHKKGAFTGADSDRKGALEQADGGTLFLDEVADLDLTVQAKLLRVLETGLFSPLGSESQKKVDVRIIAATHKNMETLISEGAFRQDLWFRLAGFELTVPSLSERPEDIPLLAEAFLAVTSREIGERKRFTEETVAVLKSSSLKGNVRELKNIVMRCAVLSLSTEITPDDLAMVISPSSGSTNSDYSKLQFKEARVLFEKEYFTEALKSCEGNITMTANKIGMAQSNLSRKIKELGLRS
jgi:DNA-binding NtrC family response regulator